MAEVTSYGYDQPNDKESMNLPQQLGQHQAPPPVYTAQPGTGYTPGYPAPGPYMGQQSQQSSTNTTVVINQPQSVRGPRNWSSGVCACCDDMGTCLCGAFVPCCLSHQVATDMGESGCVTCCVPGWLIALRLKMRTQEKIPGSLMDDCCVVMCCGQCALCQLAREIKYVQLLGGRANNAI